VWHKNGVSPQLKARRSLPPLDEAALEELALRYVGKYATTRAKLSAYLARKLRERGWAAERHPDPGALANRLSDLGYINDAGFALSKSQALSSRGYGRRRLAQRLREAGVGEEDSNDAFEAADRDAVAAAIRFAERRRIGPFAIQPPDRRSREKAIAAMVRAGHDLGLSRTIAGMQPGDRIDLLNIGESSRFYGA
jgi:regulatory protein